MTSSTAEGQTQAAEPPIQILRQRVLQLVDTVHTAQRRCDELSRQDAAVRSQQQAPSAQLTALMQERDQLSAERDALAAGQQELRKQRDGLAQQRDSLKSQVEELQGQLHKQSAQTEEQSQQREVLQAIVEELQAQLTAQSAQADKESQQKESLQMRANELLAKIESLTNKINDLSQADASTAARLNATSAKLQYYKTMAETHLNEKNLLAAYCEQLEKGAREPAHSSLIPNWEASKYSQVNSSDSNILISVNQGSLMSWIQRTIYIGLSAFGSQGPYSAGDAKYGALFPPFLTDAEAESVLSSDVATDRFSQINSSVSKLVKLIAEHKKIGNSCSCPLVNSGILMPLGASTRYAQHSLEISDSFAGPIFHLGKLDLVSNSLIIYGEWARNEIEFLSYFVTPGSMVIDVGSYLGTHARAFADIVGATGIVYAFEPNPVSYQLLLLNSSLSCGSLIAPYCIALGDSDARCSIDSSDISNLGASSVAQLHDSFNCSVPVKKLDSIKLDDKLSLSLIKIDVEGTETEVLDGATGLIADQKPIIYVEVNNPEVASRIYEWGKRHSLCAFGCTHSAYNARNHNAFETNFFSNAREYGIILVSSAKLTHQVSDYLRRKEFAQLGSTSDAHDFLGRSEPVQ